MIRPLRAHHRWTIVVIALAASILVIAGLLLRPEFPDSPPSTSVQPGPDRGVLTEAARWA